MSTTPGPNNKSPKIVALKPRNPGRFIHTIYQEDLEELLLLSRYFGEARERWEVKREEIRVALACGAQVEVGVHTAELVTVGAFDYSVRRGPSSKLVVR